MLNKCLKVCSYYKVLPHFVSLFDKLSTVLTESQQSGTSWGVKSQVLFVSSCSEILNHEDVQGKIKVACLGSLLPQDRLNQLEDQYLIHKQVKTSRLMGTAVSCSELMLSSSINVIWGFDLVTQM